MLLGLQPQARSGASTVFVVGSATAASPWPSTLVGVQEIVVKPLAWPFERVGGTAGAAMLARATSS